MRRVLKNGGKLGIGWVGRVMLDWDGVLICREVRSFNLGLLMKSNLEWF